MPTTTYIPLATVTLASATSSVTFSNIPATYRDLVLVLSNTATSGGFTASMRLNADTGSNYFDVFMLGDGTSASSGLGGATAKMDIGEVNNNVGNTILSIMDYSATDKHKALLNRYNNLGHFAIARAYRWANTGAVNSMLVYNSANANTFAVGSTFNLYGISA
jgi:hypothetical protein